MYKNHNCDKTIEEKLLEPGCMKREYLFYLRGVAFTLVWLVVLWSHMFM